jgi:hypothetical protein
MTVAFVFRSTKDLYADCVALILHLNDDELSDWPLPAGDPVEALEARVAELSHRTNTSRRDVRQDLMAAVRAGLAKASKPVISITPESVTEDRIIG